MSSTTICMTDTSVIPFPTLDSTYTQTSNAAAGPLPHIPCRSAHLSSSPSLTDTPTSPDLRTSSSSSSLRYAPQSRSATYLRYESGSTSSSSSLSDEIPTIIPRSKRIAAQKITNINQRDLFAPVTPASTPVKPGVNGRSFADLESRKQTPLRDESDEEDTLRPFPLLKQAPFCKFGQLRLEGSAGKHARHASDSKVAPSRPLAVGMPNAQQPPQTVRKKSGQPVKSSLKSARRPELHVVTDGPFAKSEPATPNLTKVVHFDSKLEHVKLFLAEQKPLAVSRDGSPTSDTSGDEFPSFIYGDNSRANQQVKMLVPNMPSSPRKGENVALQELVLSQAQRAITGSICVRNIAYEKWLAVRFTLDWWQTTSEVTARYDRSIDDDAFDVFTFTLRLNDIWPHIEEKIIFFAVRYTVAEQEYWDNNDGENYHIKFVLAPPSEPSSAVDSKANLRDLDMKLEDLAKARSAPVPITSYRLARSFSADHQYSSFAKSMSTRYDFASAYRTQSVRNAPPQLNRHVRTHTHPSGVLGTAGPTVAPWSDTLMAHETEKVTPPPRSQSQSLSLGSPRETTDGTPTPPACSEMKPALLDSLSPSRFQDSRERNHRRGYVDKVVEGSPSLRRTPTGSPLRFDVMNKDTAAHLPRTRSYPLTAGKPGPMVSLLQQSTPKPPLSIQIEPADDEESEEPTPYEASQSSSSSISSCTPLFSPSSGTSQSTSSYKQFLDRFCFYTGGDSFLQESSEALPRSRSVSSIEPYLLSHSPPQSFSSHMRDSPSRFLLDSSGSATPTAVVK